MKTGINQGCCIPSLPFLLVVDWITRKTTRYGNTGIRWFLEDFDFAGDIALISRKREHIQTKVNNLGRYERMTSVKIRTAKTMKMRWNSPTKGKEQFDGEELE